MISHRYSSLVLSFGLLLSSCGGKGGGGSQSNPPVDAPLLFTGGGEGEAGGETLGLNCHSAKGKALTEDEKFLKDLDTLVFASDTEAGQKLARAITGNGWNCK